MFCIEQHSFLLVFFFVCVSTFGLAVAIQQNVYRDVHILLLNHLLLILHTKSATFPNLYSFALHVCFKLYLVFP